MALTDWRLYLLDDDFTAKAEWGVDIVEVLGQPATARFTLQDRFMGDYDFADVFGGGVTLEEIDTRVEILGAEIPAYRGKVLSDDVALPNMFPWRNHTIGCTDYQREIFDRRLIGVPTGELWDGPDPQGNYLPVDPLSLFGLGQTDKGAIQSMFTGVGPHALLPIGTIDADTFVNEYVPDGMNGAPFQAERSKIRNVMEWLAGQVGGNVQYWMDPGLRLHWQVIPRWFESESEAGALLTMFPETGFPMELAPVEIDNDNPNGTTSIGCRNLGWTFDYTSLLHQHYVVGGVGFAREPLSGVVDKKGTGWVTYGNVDQAPNATQAQELLDYPASVDLGSKLAAGRRAENSVTRGILRGKLTVGGKRHHPDGFHVGQKLKITDSRMPIYLRGRYFTIQRVTMKLLPGQNWRIYDIEWGDAPQQRVSTRVPSVQAPPERAAGRLWGISGNTTNPRPGSTVTVAGQLMDDAQNPRRAYGVPVPLELHVWDADGNEIDPVSVGAAISPEEVTTDAMGQWFTAMTVGESGYYCVCPVGAGTYILELPA